jgi:hypothetical protein
MRCCRMVRVVSSVGQVSCSNDIFLFSNLPFSTDARRYGKGKASSAVKRSRNQQSAAFASSDSVAKVTVAKI